MLSSRKRARVNCGKPEKSTGSMVQSVYSAGPVVRIALLIVLDHCSVYIGIRHADHGAGWSGCQKGFLCDGKRQNQESYIEGLILSQISKR